MTSAERAKALFWYTHRQGQSSIDLEMNLVDTIAEFAKAIDAAVAEALPRWVPVTERLPEHTRPVLVTFMSRDYHTLAPGPVVMEAYYDGGAWYRRDALHLRRTVLAWQPLPAPWVAP